MDQHLAHLTDPDTPLAIIGLGYVGLPLAVEFAKHRPVIGFDINRARIAELQAGHDSTRETSSEDLAAARHLASPAIWTPCAPAASSSSPCPLRSTTTSGPTSRH